MWRARPGSLRQRIGLGVALALALALALAPALAMWAPASQEEGLATSLTPSLPAPSDTEVEEGARLRATALYVYCSHL